MTSFRNRFTFFCLGIVGTAGLASLSSPGLAASTDEVRRAQVVIADLDLHSAAGRVAFEHRVTSAARTVCAEPNYNLSANQAEAACRSQALAQARRDAGLVQIAAN